MAGPAGTGVHTITGKFYGVDEPGKVVFQPVAFYSRMAATALKI
jgi:hypothetical protein